MKQKVMASLEPENMGLLPKRLMACFIDMVLISAVAILIHVPLAVAGTVLPSILIRLISLVVLAICGALVLFKDGPYQVAILDKQSVGKKAMNIRVTKSDGETAISWKDSMQRNMLLAVPMLVSMIMQVLMLAPIPFLTGTLLFFIGVAGGLLSLAMYAFEVFNMWKDPENRRWGDIQAGTKVILGE